jgi:hypothetical protein
LGVGRFEYVLRSDGRVVEKTEPIGLCGLGVVATRPSERVRDIFWSVLYRVFDRPDRRRPRRR